MSSTLTKADQTTQQLFTALKGITEYWAYGMAKPDGAEPDTADERRVEEIADECLAALRAYDPTYIPAQWRRPTSPANPPPPADCGNVERKHLTMPLILTAGENTFGKIHGRFNEAAARASDRALADAAMAALIPMPADEWPRFIKMFNDAFRWGENAKHIECEA